MKTRPLTLAALLISSSAWAKHPRPRFEPTDLDLEEPGILQVDMQYGPAWADSGHRFFLPDFEIDLGLLPNLELGLDGAFTLEGYDRRSRSLSGDPLWTALKIGLYDSRSPNAKRTLAFGVQIGPRIPTLSGHGVGGGALALLCIGDQELHVVLNMGGLVDPGDSFTAGASRSLVAGADVSMDLDDKGKWAALGAMAGAHYLTDDYEEFTTAAGIGWSGVPHVDLSALVVAGLLPGNDRVALLLGVSPNFALW